MANIKTYIAIARPSHWIKNLFVIPGFIAAQMFESQFSAINFLKLIIVLISTSLIASANYVLNEWLDAKSDAHHPLKKNRPSVIGSVFLREIVILYIFLSILGLAASVLISKNVLYIIVGFQA
jgi:4-hydroxybenzoate polyprenyltransferase